MDEFDDILVAIRRITRAIDLHSKQLVKRSGLTVPQLLVLQSISRKGSPSIGAVAQDVSLAHATVTAVVERLERAGLVTRTRSQTDRRVVEVTLSEAGQSRLADAPELMQSNFTREFTKLEVWEQHMLRAALERVAQMMDAEALDASPILDVGEIPKSDQ